MSDHRRDGISLKRAPCGDHSPHRAHTYRKAAGDGTCLGLRDTNPQPWIPGDNQVTGTLGTAGYPPPSPRQGDVSPYVLDLAQHPAVVKHGAGTTSEELASFTECMASLAAGRIRTVGHEQYSGDFQKFEGASLYKVAEDLLEELADVISYASMSAIKMLAMVRAMEGSQNV